MIFVLLLLSCFYCLLSDLVRPPFVIPSYSSLTKTFRFFGFSPMMDNRTAHHAGSSHRPSRSILKSPRSSHGRQRARSPSPASTSPPLPTRRTVQIVDAPETQITRSLAGLPAHGPIPEMTITFPAVRDAEHLEQLAFEFARQLQARRRQLESNLTRDHRLLDPPKPPPPLPSHPIHAPDEYPEFRDILMGPWQAGANCTFTRSIYSS